MSANLFKVDEIGGIADVFNAALDHASEAKIVKVDGDGNYGVEVNGNIYRLSVPDLSSRYNGAKLLLRLFELAATVNPDER